MSFSNAERARRVFGALIRRFASGDGSGLYRETAPVTGERYAYLWPFTQVLAAGCDLCGVSGAFVAQVRGDVQRGLSHYWDATSVPPGYDAYVRPPYGNGSDKYYDDNAWVGLDLLRAARVMDDPSLVDEARRVFRFIATGWDTNPADPFPGGVFWTQAQSNRDRNTVSNMPPAELALRLFQLTGKRDYLVWALRMYDWVNATLRDPSDGLYWDHVTIAGLIDETKWSYNQGSAVGVNLLLHEIHREPDPDAGGDHLARAQTIAAAALRYYEPIGYFGQDPPFNAIFFRNLHALAKVTKDEQLRRTITRTMQQYADTVWERYRDDDDLLVFRSDAPARLIDQAALVQVYALLAS